MSKTFAVLGANGFVGREVVTQLANRGDQVIAVLKDSPQSIEFEEWAMENLPGLQWLNMVANALGDEIMYRSSLENLDMPNIKLDGFVYTVGHCPAGGITEQISTPLHRKWPEQILRELDLHAVGFHRAMLGLGPYLAEKAAVVVVSSAVTELSDDQCPAFLEAGSYAVAKAAQDEMVKWWRRNNLILQSGIRIHLLKPGALDTPFMVDGYKPPNLIPLPTFAVKIIATLDSHETITETIRDI